VLLFTEHISIIMQRITTLNEEQCLNTKRLITIMQLQYDRLSQQQLSLFILLLLFLSLPIIHITFLPFF